MAKKRPVRKPRTIDGRFTSLERLVRAGFRQTDARFQSFQKQTDARLQSFQKQTDARFRGLSSDLSAFRKETDTRFSVAHLELRNLRKEINERFAGVEDRIDRLATHVDGFMKLHETLDIEMQVMKEQMNRFEERLKRLEAAQAS